MINHLTPTASIKTQILLLAIMWSVVGPALLYFGLRCMFTSDTQPLILYPLVITALIMGWMKARYALTKATKRIIHRIIQRGEGRCLFGFISAGMWILILLMMVIGRFLRTSDHIPLIILGFIYTAVGFALLLASKYAWRAISYKQWNGRLAR